MDLNLLQALEALLQECSVSRAAARLHVTQPAMSRTLARIREATGDPILVRSGRQMVASPRGLAMRGEVAALVLQARTLLAPERALDPSRLERTFTLRCHDVLLEGLGPGLLRRLQREAPGVTVRFVAEESGSLDHPTLAQVDLDIGATRAVSPSLRQEELGHDRLAVAMRKDHPAARGRLTARRYAAAAHVVVSRRGRLGDPVDEALEALGLRRRVVATMPTAVAGLQLARECHLLVAVAERACASMVRAMGLVVRPLPVASAPVPLIQVWPEHLDHDLGHTWLRGLTRAVIAEQMKRPARA